MFQFSIFSLQPPSPFSSLPSYTPFPSPNSFVQQNKKKKPGKNKEKRKKKKVEKHPQENGATSISLPYLLLCNPLLKQPSHQTVGLQKDHKPHFGKAGPSLIGIWTAQEWDGGIGQHHHCQSLQLDPCTKKLFFWAPHSQTAAFWTQERIAPSCFYSVLFLRVVGHCGLSKTSAPALQRVSLSLC